jgi:hypothetical protein
MGDNGAIDMRERAVNAITDPIDRTRAEAIDRLRELETALIAHGFTVEVEAKLWALTVTTRAELLSPARSQRVQVATDGTAALSWYLVSPGSEEHLVQCERLCPAAAIAEATERIAHELRTGGQR